MESIEAYLERKTTEITYLVQLLHKPIIAEPPKTVHEVVELKFRLRAFALSEAVCEHQNMTETCRTDEHEHRFGGYVLRYGYQRFDLDVSGPPVFIGSIWVSPSFAVCHRPQSFRVNRAPTLLQLGMP